MNSDSDKKRLGMRQRAASTPDASSSLNTLRDYMEKVDFVIIDIDVFNASWP